MILKNQRRLAASILGVGLGRVWIDPEKSEDIEAAITRSEIRKLIHEGAIRAAPLKGQSRARARALAIKKRLGRRRGPGTRKGAVYSVISRKERWISRIRSQRDRLGQLRSRRLITVATYRDLYVLAKGGRFRSVAELERYITEQNLRRRAFG